MNLEKLSSFVSRFFFLAAFVFLVLATLEWGINLFGYTVLRAIGYQAGRLLEFAVILLVFVLAILLRQVRDELRRVKT